MKVGDIVTVISGEYSVRNRQGEILKISDSGVTVKFGSECPDWYFESDGRERVLKKENLRVDPDGLTLETRTERMFPNYYHSIFELRTPFKAGVTICSCDGCDGKTPATKTALVNVWGSVYEVPVCDDHFGINGRCSDDLPIRRD